MKKMTNSVYAKLVSIACVVSVCVAILDYWLGCALLLLVAVPMALWYNIRLKKEKKGLEEDGVRGIIRCECFEGGDFCAKGTQVTVYVYSDALVFINKKQEELGRILRGEITAAQVLSLDEVCSGSHCINMGKLRDTILETDRMTQKKKRKTGNASYLILNLGDSVISFFITTEDQREDRLYFQEGEASAIEAFISNRA